MTIFLSVDGEQRRPGPWFAAMAKDRGSTIFDFLGALNRELRREGRWIIAADHAADTPLARHKAISVRTRELSDGELSGTSALAEVIRQTIELHQQAADQLRLEHPQGQPIIEAFEAWDEITEALDSYNAVGEDLDDDAILAWDDAMCRFRDVLCLERVRADASGDERPLRLVVADAFGPATAALERLLASLTRKR